MVLRYFYLVDQADLLFALLGEPLLVPPIVFDPDEEPGASERAKSEIARSIQVQRTRARDRSRDERERQIAAEYAKRLESIGGDHTAGRIEVTNLLPEETELFAMLASPGDARVGHRFRLHPGEAACVAIAVKRELVLVTDDTDALKTYRHLRPNGRYERIRKLLERAADSRLVSRAEADDIHQAMRQAGFWDKGRLFR